MSHCHYAPSAATSNANPSAAERDDATRFVGIASMLRRELDGARARVAQALAAEGAPSSKWAKREHAAVLAKLDVLELLGRSFTEPDTAFASGLAAELRERSGAERPRLVTLAMASGTLLTRTPALTIEPNGDGSARASHDAPLRRASFAVPAGAGSKLRRIAANATPPAAPPCIFDPAPAAQKGARTPRKA